ncbi:MAG TPA: DUF3455 domain-containing protein [Steroidobacteraceae bacterium]|nr:DUF3455 domain-containing protein [Steroidobacteraceae bacterium]
MSTQRSMVRICRLALLTAGAALAGSPLPPAAAVPEALRTPAGEIVVLAARASGSQIYLCAVGADGKAQWTLKAPDAELRDDKGKIIGHHSAGPVWKLNDGSEVTGKATARVDAPEPHSIPWLLLSVVSHAGRGVLAAVTHIQRIHTHGGEAPPAAQCDATRANAEARSPYSADYYFYAPDADEAPQGSPY